MTEIIKDIECGRITNVYASSLDRIHRDHLSCIMFLKRCTELEVKVTLADSNMSMESPFEEAFTYIRSIFAHFEHQEIISRTKKGLRGGLNEGIYTVGGPAPFGFKGIEEKGILVFDNKKDVVEKVINEYVLTQKSVLSISEEMNLSYKIVYAILTTPIYRGYHIYEGQKYPLKSDFYIQVNSAEKIDYKIEIMAREHVNTYLFKDKLICFCCETKLSVTVTNKKMVNTFIIFAEIKTVLVIIKGS